MDRDLAGSLPARQPSQPQALEIGCQAALRRPHPNNPLEKPLEVCFSDYKKNLGNRDWIGNLLEHQNIDFWVFEERDKYSVGDTRLASSGDGERLPEALHDYGLRGDYNTTYRWRRT